MLQRDHDVRRRVPEQRPGEDRPAPEPVGEKAAKNGADEEAGEQGGDEARDPGRAEQAPRLRGQHARLDQARRDIGREQEIVELEEHAEAEQRRRSSRSCASPAAGRCGPKSCPGLAALLRSRSWLPPDARARLARLRKEDPRFRRLSNGPGFPWLELKPSLLRPKRLNWRRGRPGSFRGRAMLAQWEAPGAKSWRQLNRFNRLGAFFCHSLGVIAPEDAPCEYIQIHNVCKHRRQARGAPPPRPAGNRPG